MRSQAKKKEEDFRQKTLHGDLEIQVRVKKKRLYMCHGSIISWSSRGLLLLLYTMTIDVR